MSAGHTPPRPSGGDGEENTPLPTPPTPPRHSPSPRVLVTTTIAPPPLADEASDVRSHSLHANSGRYRPGQPRSHEGVSVESHHDVMQRAPSPTAAATATGGKHVGQEDERAFSLSPAPPPQQSSSSAVAGSSSSVASSGGHLIGDHARSNQMHDPGPAQAKLEVTVVMAAVPGAGESSKHRSSSTTETSELASKKNPLLPEGNVEDDGSDCSPRMGTRAGTAGGATDETVSSSATGASGAGSALIPGISELIQRLPNPTNAEEYFAMVSDLDRMRCPLGAELTPIAKQVYGPTIPFNQSLPHSRILGWTKTDAPNCEHREPIQFVAGHKFYVPLLLMLMLGAYAALNTVAYYRIAHWATMLVIWIFFLGTLVYGVICAFTNPGIAPRRIYTKDVKDRGDVIVVRVPAANARRVQMRQREVAAQEAATAAASGGAAGPGAAGSPSTKRRQNATSSGLERYFESQTGRLYPVAPLFSEQEKQYRYRDSKDNEGREGSKEVAVVEFPLSYCWTCGMYKAPRTHHCGKCNCCVDDHDHHCPWTGCCIGRGNYRYFFMCLLCLHLMVMYTVLLSFGLNFAWMVKNPRKDFKDLLGATYYLPPILYAAVFGFGIFFSPLFLSHVYMSAKGFTTSEMLKSKFKDSNYFLGVNPWDKGVLGNYNARMFGRYDKWTDTRYYYSVTIAGVLEDKRVDWLLVLPPEERAKVQAREAKVKSEMEEAWTKYHNC